MEAYWQAPECWGSGIYTPSSDIFSFGLLAWSLFVGKEPYYGKFCAETATKVKGGWRLPLDAVPPQFHQLLTSCWSMKLSDRITAKGLCGCLCTF